MLTLPFMILRARFARLRSMSGFLCFMQLFVFTLLRHADLSQQFVGVLDAELIVPEADLAAAHGSPDALLRLGLHLRAESKVIHAALGGKGGGQPSMIQGSVPAKRAEIEAYFA